MRRPPPPAFIRVPPGLCPTHTARAPHERGKPIVSEALIVALTTTAGVLFGYILRAAQIAASNKVTVQRNAIEGFSELCEKLTARLTTVEAQLVEAQRRITQLEAEITTLQHANHMLRLKIDDSLQPTHGH